MLVNCSVQQRSFELLSMPLNEIRCYKGLLAIEHIGVHDGTILF